MFRKHEDLSFSRSRREFRRTGTHRNAAGPRCGMHGKRFIPMKRLHGAGSIFHRRRSASHCSKPRTVPIFPDHNVQHWIFPRDETVQHSRDYVQHFWKMLNIRVCMSNKKGKPLFFLRSREERPTFPSERSIFGKIYPTSHGNVRHFHKLVHHFNNYVHHRKKFVQNERKNDHHPEKNVHHRRENVHHRIRCPTSGAIGLKSVPL